MLIAKKANRRVRIPDEKKKEYIAMGYTILEPGGKVVAEPQNLKLENEKLKKQVEPLEKENAELKKQVESLKTENAELEEKLAAAQEKAEKAAASKAEDSKTGKAAEKAPDAGEKDAKGTQAKK